MENKIYQALCLLLDLSDQSQRKIIQLNGNALNISPKSWAKEFSTVHVKTARQTGHDMAIMELIRNSKDNVLGEDSTKVILDYSLSMSLKMKKILVNDLHLNVDKVRFSAIDSIQYTRGLSNVKAIIINNSWGYSTKDIDLVYETFSWAMMEKLNNKEPFFFIFLH